MKPTPTVFNVPPGVAFVDALVAGIRARHGIDPIALSGVTVLLPTRRACRALRDAFLRLSNGRPTLLPVMRPIGDVEEDELALALGEQDWEGDDPRATLDLAPALSPLRRRLLLSRLVLASRPDTPPDQALFLAGELARLLDQMQIEEVSFDALHGIVRPDLAEHWQKILTFLEILSHAWPAILQSEGMQDPAVRRSKLLDAQAKAWERQPPHGPVIAAGSTGTVPATARLLRVIGRLPQGCIVLPGLDGAMSEAVWEQIDPTHPQFAMKHLLDRLGVARGAVQDWPSGLGLASSPARIALLAEALKPPPAWAEPSPVRIDAAACAGVHRLDCANPEEEARAVALAMREALETEGRTAALVTPDRGLARRVTAELARWDLAVDDSAGTPLGLTPAGTFLRLTAVMIADRLPPVALLAALKHPLAAGGGEAWKFRRLARRLDRTVLRGPRPAPGFAGLQRAVDLLPKEAAETAAELRPWLAHLAALAAPFAAVIEQTDAELPALLRTHVRLAEALAADSDKADAGLRLWANEDGEAAAVWLEELLRVAAGDTAPRFDGRHYPRVLAELMAGVTVRPRYAKHPRLHIWGPLEARLQQADVVILAGLNEGTWPPDVSTDAWMSRPMRHKAGLPVPERRVGLAAHDFVQAAAAPLVLLTRSTKVDGAPTVPSRWLDRLQAVLGANALTLPSVHWLDWQRKLVDPERVNPLPAPAPRPPVSKRPRAMSATTIEKWVRDPYEIYAKHVLRLRALDKIDEDPGARERGQVIHDAIDRFLKCGIDARAPEALAQMIESGRMAFDELLVRPGVWAFWWPRYRRIAEWFIATERGRSPEARLAASEIKGSLDIGGFTVSATADRIDRRTDGSLVIIDYKTGSVPTGPEIERGFAPQLPIEGMLAAASAFPGVPKDIVAQLSFWKLSGLREGGAISFPAETPDEAKDLIDKLTEGLRAFIDAFDDPNMPYRSRPRPEFGPRYSDYDHLARVREWSAGPGEDDVIALVPLQGPR